MKVGRNRKVWCCAVLVGLALVAGVGPASAIVVGFSGEFHQDIRDPTMWPNDVHIEGTVYSSDGVWPTLIQHCDGPFPNFDYTIKQDDANPNEFHFTADWWLDPDQAPIPYCTVIDLCIFIDVNGKNIIVDLRGWWTRDGVRVEAGQWNSGYFPVMGFNVEDFINEPLPPHGQLFQLVNGNYNGKPGDAQIPVEIVQLDLVPLDPGGLEVLGKDPFSQLRVDGLQKELPWIPVIRSTGQPISPEKPVPLAPDSFFNVYYQKSQPHSDGFTVAEPFRVVPDGYLLARGKMRFTNNNGGREIEERWFWEVHGAEPIVQACCLADGSCVDAFKDVCLSLNGTPMGEGTNCATVDCPKLNTGACCLPDGTCVDTIQDKCLELGGDWKGLGTSCNTPMICDAALPFFIEFSVDIGSDRELSDPFVDGDEGFDPGDVYLWRSALVPPGGRDGFKDDEFIFRFDPFPDPFDGATPPATRVPVGVVFSPPDSPKEWYLEFFDLDGHDQLDLSIFEKELLNPANPSPQPISPFDSRCIHMARFLGISMDDDDAPGWMAPPFGNVPVTSPSPIGNLYGTTAGRDEVIGIEIVPVFQPSPVIAVNPYASEVMIHGSLAPNPDVGEKDDDDVDSLDIVEHPEICPHWYFSPDHEATWFDMTGSPLDPGDIYEVLPGGPIKVVDEVIHLGVPEETDIDAFEFVWMEYEDGPVVSIVFALLFSVDDDDPLTPADESGGLLPGMIYASVFTGFSVPTLEEPLRDDVDALMAWQDEALMMGKAGD